VVLAFSEAVVARGSSVVVSDPDRAPRGRVQPLVGLVTSADRRTLTADLGRALRPGVFQVRWTVLGDDGHRVSGHFAFGVAGSGGAPPAGAERLTPAAAGGRGGERASADGVVAVVARWLGILAASLLLGGTAASLRLRRRAPAVLDRVHELATAAWLLIALAASEGALAAAASGAGDSFDFGLLTGSRTGRVELVRALLVPGAAVAFALRGLGPARWRSERAAVVLHALGGAAVLATYAIAGHVLALGHGVTVAVVLQVAHVLAAGLWVGGVVALALAARRTPLSGTARGFAPLAAAALAVAVVTGVLAAIREVDRWYFLRWSDYGRVVLAKAVLVALAAGLGALAARRARRRAAPRRWLLRLEAGGLLTVIALGATLAGLAQGRGQPLPAQRGNLLPGPAVATVVLAGSQAAGAVALTLAPGRAGDNVLAATVDPARTGALTVRLACSCSKRAVVAEPRRRVPGGAAVADVRLPADGTWFAYVTVAGRAAPSPAALAVGVPSAAGAAPLVVLSVADLSGPEAARCRAHVLGFELAIGRLNAAGGLDGGHKVAPVVLDDGGDPAAATRLVRRALDVRRPIALAAPCGAAAAAAVALAGRAGVPVVVGDPAVDPIAAPHVHRLASDPYAEGFALGRYAIADVRPSALRTARSVVVMSPGDRQAQRRLTGLRAALGRALRVRVVAPRAVTAVQPATLARLLDRRRTLAFVADGGSPAALARALRGIEDKRRTLLPAPVFVTERLASERLVVAAGALGRIGVLRVASEVSPDSRDGVLYARALPVLFPGERPTLDGLRGFATGLALLEGVRDGTSPAAIEARLRLPRPFTDALTAPWREDAPAAGSPRLTVLGPTFLPATLVPAFAGGESYTGKFFPDGAWARLSTEAYGPPLGSPVPSLGTG
jgi:putative copper export protein